MTQPMNLSNVWKNTYEASTKNGINPNFGAFVKQNFNTGLGDYRQQPYKSGLADLFSKQAPKNTSVVGNGIGQKPSPFTETVTTPSAEGGLYMPTIKPTQYEDTKTKFSALSNHNAADIMDKNPAEVDNSPSMMDTMGIDKNLGNASIPEVESTDSGFNFDLDGALSSANKVLGLAGSLTMMRYANNQNKALRQNIRMAKDNHNRKQANFSAMSNYTAPGG